METKVRFLLVNAIVGVAACVLFFGLLGDRPTVSARTADAAQGVKGDAERGKYLVQIGTCMDCHGNFKMTTDKGVPLAGGTEFNLGPVGKYYSANLTTLQNWKLEDFLKVFHEGIDPQSKRVLAPIMPYESYHGMSDDDVAAIAAYLQSLTPVKNDVPKAEPGPVAALALHALPAVSVPAQKASDAADYGRYIVENVSACGDCHSPRDATQAKIKGRDLSGGGINLGTNEEPLFASPILGSILTAEGYTHDSFVVALRSGVRPWGAKIPVQMPWRLYANMTDSDITAVWNFLQTKKLDTPWPAPNAIPPRPTEPSGGGTSATPAATAAK